MPKVIYRSEKYQVWNDSPDSFQVEKISPIHRAGSKADALAFVHLLVKPPPPPPPPTDSEDGSAGVKIEEVFGWHFIDRSMKLSRGGGQQKVGIGETIHLDGPIVPVKNGLLVSQKAIVAITYGRRPIVCRVKGTGEIVPHGDEQFSVSDRTCIWVADATNTIINWGGWCAIRALTQLEDAGTPMNPGSISAAEFTMNFNGSDDPTALYQRASAAAFSYMGDMLATSAASAASNAISAAFFRFNQLKMEASFQNFPKPPQSQQTSMSQSHFSPQMPSSPPPQLADFAVVSSTNAASTASHAFPDADEETEIQNAELERRLLLLAPPEA